MSRRAKPPATVRALVMAAAALFALAPTLPALATCSQFGGPEWLGNTNIVLLGFLGPIFFEFGWYANIFAALNAIRLLRGVRPNIYMLMLQAILTLAAFVPAPQIGPSEAPAWICRWGPGFWMWFTSQALVLIGAILARVARADVRADAGPANDD